MTRGTFSAAIDRIDSVYVSEALNYTPDFKKANKKTQVIRIASAAACFAIVFAIALAVFWQKSPGNPDNPAVPTADSIAFNFNEDNGEPTVTSRCLTKTQSFFKRGEKIAVIAAIGDTYTKNAMDEYNVMPTYNNAEKTGYPVFYVSDVKNNMDCLGENYGLKNNRADSRMIINGSVGYYEKIFSVADMEKLDILDYYDASDYHTESIVIDFDGYSEGEHGALCIGFGWWFTDYNPYSPDKKNGSLAGFENILYYYVGKTGIGLSYNSCEEAKLNLEKDGEIGLMVDDRYCAEEKLFAVCQNITKTFLHGSTITCHYNENPVRSPSFSF